MSNKATKRALLTSALALLLCVSMLVGTTYAWFTDSVTSANNKIVAGNLKIDLELLGDNGWTSIKESPKAIFDYENWEPGYTDMKILKIENEGSLALKWVAKFVSNEALGILADVIDVYVTEDIETYPTDRADLSGWDKVGTVRDFANTIDTLWAGSLTAKNTAGATKTLGIALKMQETAGNEYQGLNLGAFDIQILATQYTYEDDSFGDDYDEDAPFGTYVELNEGDDLLAAMASAAADMPLTIKLNGNVEWPTDGHHGENDITPASSIVINGNGYTITAIGSGVTPLGDTEAPMTLKNVKIVDNSVSYKESAWEFTYLELGGTSLTCDNVTFADEIQLGTNATFTNCSFESNEESVYAVWVEDGSATFTNCTFTGYRGLKAHEDYGTEIIAVVVEDCTFQNISKKPGIALGRICMNGDTYTSGSTTYTNTTDTNVSITGSTFINCQAGDQGLYIYETDTDVTTINFTEDDNTVLNNATVVTTKDELLALSAKALTGNNGTAEEAIIIIGAEIDMAGAEFSAIIAQRGDKLTVLGNGHTISNVKIVSGANDNTTGQASMFYAYPNSTLTVSNLTLKDVTVTAEANGTGYAAAVVGYCEGEAILNNVDVVNATVTGVKSSGMLVGHLSGSLTATNCDLSGSVTLADFAEEANGHYAGKYVGTLAGAMTLTDCTANVTVSGNLSAKNLGDIYGRKTAAGSSNVEFAKNNTDFGTAIAGGADTVILGSGNYVIPVAAKGKTLTIIGTGDTSVAVTKVGSGGENCDFGLDGSTVTFENVTITTNSSTYIGYARCNGTYKNCTFNGTYTLYGDSVFENCTFNVSGDVYNLWTWGAPTATFTGCTFNSDGKALLLYGTVNTKLTVNDCTFNDNGGLADLKAAIEIGNDYGKSYELIVNNTTVNGYEINDKGISTGTTLWANKNSMGTDKLNVVVDGVDKY